MYIITTDGKESMMLGVGSFSKATSNAYNVLPAPDREALKERGSGILKAKMTRREITKHGARKFLKIQKLVSMCTVCYTGLRV